jgi:hypothetical protein
METWCYQLTVGEILSNLNNIVYGTIALDATNSDLDYVLNMMKNVTEKTGGRFRGKFGQFDRKTLRFDSKLVEILGKGFLNTAGYKIHLN